MHFMLYCYQLCYYYHFVMQIFQNILNFLLLGDKMKIFERLLVSHNVYNLYLLKFSNNILLVFCLKILSYLLPSNCLIDYHQLFLPGFLLVAINLNFAIFLLPCTGFLTFNICLSHINFFEINFIRLYIAEDHILLFSLHLACCTSHNDQGTLILNLSVIQIT